MSLPLEWGSSEQREIAFDGTWSGWRAAARSALSSELAPSQVVWRLNGDAQSSLLAAREFPVETVRAKYSVPKNFLDLASDVACYRDFARWSVLYRVLWRITHGERELLDVFVDVDVYALQKMAKTIRREGHKMRAFVRFRRIDDEGERYVAWFEPEHDVAEREAPFFARRFPAMRWSIMTPDVVVNWNRSELSYSPGVPREMAPRGDDLENLWRTYYANIFNPARVKTRMMRSEMAVRYWKNLPEAQMIAPLVRDAPARMVEMIERAERMALIPGGERPGRVISAAAEPLAVDAGVAQARVRSDRARAFVADRTRENSSAASGRQVRVGVASWTDPTMTAPGVFYPSGPQSAESRLRYYASRFSLVEVDSTYYAMPSEKVAHLWVERTPDDFVFDVKAHALMTGHSTATGRLPAELQSGLPAHFRAAREVSGRMLPPEFIDEIWRRFLLALTPLRDSGKLGALLLQLPRDFLPTQENEAMIAGFRERAGNDMCAVEFRHRSWVADERRTERTMALLRDHDLGFVMVDAPPGFETSMPVMTDVTSERIAVVRMHGRRTDTWERAVDVVSERYRYLYEAAQLEEWIPRIVDVAYRTQGVHIVMNNCHANYGTANADEITAMLVERDELRRSR